jgi:hypothetical protein
MFMVVFRNMPGRTYFDELRSVVEEGTSFAGDYLEGPACQISTSYEIGVFCELITRRALITRTCVRDRNLNCKKCVATRPRHYIRCLLILFTERCDT